MQRDLHAWKWSVGNAAFVIWLAICCQAVAQPPSERDEDGLGRPPHDETPHEEDAPAGAEAIQQQRPGFLVRADVNHETRTYREGDGLSLRVTCEIDAFVYVLYQPAAGKTYQIFPNADHPDNRVRARQTVQIPRRVGDGDDDLFTWTIDQPFGKELIKVIASTEPIDPLADAELRKEFFNPLPAGTLKGVEFALGERDPVGWAEDQIEIVTHPRDANLAAGGAKRWGVFFGVANYEFNTEFEQASDGKSDMNLPTCHRDARRMAEVLREVGQLSGVRAYTNEQATRRNIEQAVTRWLPSVSRPGDTVVVYFSGHGLQMPDDNRDEADGLDEILLPYDFMDVNILAVLVQRAKEGKLPAHLGPRVKAALQTVQRAGSVEKGNNLLRRQTGISDDLFGHWAQRLAGRQVVVIIDACHAGGFATQEKGETTETQAPMFDFLDQEFSRLKDLGQRDMALLGACRARELAGIRVQGDLSIMTKYLIDSIVQAAQPLTLEQGFEECSTGMHQYFVELNSALLAAGKPSRTEHRPFLVDYCRRPPLLRP